MRARCIWPNQFRDPLVKRFCIPRRGTEIPASAAREIVIADELIRRFDPPEARRARLLPLLDLLANAVARQIIEEAQNQLDDKLSLRGR